MKNCQFHNTLTVRTLLRVFMGSTTTSTSTIDQGTKAILGNWREVSANRGIAPILKPFIQISALSRGTAFARF